MGSSLIYKDFFFKRTGKNHNSLVVNHVLHQVLHVVMDEELGGNMSPNIEYPFIPELVKNY